MARLKRNDKGVEQLLKGGRVVRDLTRRTNRIAAAAGPGMKASVQVGDNRARGSVITATEAAKRREARDRALTRAIDAGR